MQSYNTGFFHLARWMSLGCVRVAARISPLLLFVGEWVTHCMGAPRRPYLFICWWLLLFSRCVWLFVIPWTEARLAPLSMEFPKQRSWSGLPFLSPGDLPHPGIKSAPPAVADVLFFFNHWASRWAWEPQDTPHLLYLLISWWWAFGLFPPFGS